MHTKEGNGTLEVKLEAVPTSVEHLSNRELIKHITDSAVALAKTEVQLAKAELKADLKAELAMVKGLGIAALCVLLTVNLLLVAAVFALANVMPGWAAALLVAAVVMAVGAAAGMLGWKKRVKEPLAATRRTLKEDARWARERIA